MAVNTKQPFVTSAQCHIDTGKWSLGFTPSPLAAQPHAASTKTPPPLFIPKPIRGLLQTNKSIYRRSRANIRGNRLNRAEIKKQCELEV